MRQNLACRGPGRYIKLSLIGGNLGGASMTSLYYPPRVIGITIRSFRRLGSMGGSAVGYVVSEFIGDLSDFFHHSKKNVP